MLTLLEILQKTTEFLGGKGVESPRLNAELIIGHALGRKRMQLYLEFERLLTEPELEKIRPLVRRRALREPIQYVLGETEWCGMKLKVDRRALIPRPETELLVELVTGVVQNPPARSLDLGTGTGALALALARHYATAEVVAVDKSAAALELARENATAIGVADRVRFVQSDWFAALSNDPPFDLIVANPPYLSEREVSETAPEVRDFEPRDALVSDADGMKDLQAIVHGASAHLNPSGLLAMETGIAQHAALVKACADAGFSRTESKQDLTGRDRFILAWR